MQGPDIVFTMKNKKINQDIKSNSIQNKDGVIAALQLPKDIVTGSMKIELTGNREAWIENYRGLLEYTDQCIRLQGKHGQLQIEGKSLCIAYYTNEDMKICGCFDSIKFI